MTSVFAQIVGNVTKSSGAYPQHYSLYHRLIGCKLQQNANEGCCCNSCATLAWLLVVAAIIFKF